MVELSYGKLKDAQGRDYVEQNLHAMEVVTATIHGYIVDLIPACKRTFRFLVELHLDRATRNRSEIPTELATRHEIQTRRCQVEEGD